MLADLGLDNLGLATYLSWSGVAATVIADFNSLVVVLRVTTFAEGLEFALVAPAWNTLENALLILSLLDLFLDDLDLCLVLESGLFFHDGDVA